MDDTAAQAARTLPCFICFGDHDPLDCPGAEFVTDEDVADWRNRERLRARIAEPNVGTPLLDAVREIGNNGRLYADRYERATRPAHLRQDIAHGGVADWPINWTTEHPSPIQRSGRAWEFSDTAFHHDPEAADHEPQSISVPWRGDIESSMQPYLGLPGDTLVSFTGDAVRQTSRERGSSTPGRRLHARRRRVGRRSMAVRGVDIQRDRLFRLAKSSVASDSRPRGFYALAAGWLDSLADRCRMRGMKRV